MSKYPWNMKNITFTWFSSLYNPFNPNIFDETVYNTITIKQQLKEDNDPIPAKSAA